MRFIVVCSLRVQFVDSLLLSLLTYLLDAMCSWIYWLS